MYLIIGRKLTGVEVAWLDTNIVGKCEEKVMLT